MDKEEEYSFGGDSNIEKDNHSAGGSQSQRLRANAGVNTNLSYFFMFVIEYNISLNSLLLVLRSGEL